MSNTKDGLSAKGIVDAAEKTIDFSQPFSSYSPDVNRNQSGGPIIKKRAYGID